MEKTTEAYYRGYMTAQTETREKVLIAIHKLKKGYDAGMISTIEDVIDVISDEFELEE